MNQLNALPPVVMGVGYRTILGKAFPGSDFPGSVFDLIFLKNKKRANALSFKMSSDPKVKFVQLLLFPALVTSDPLI